MIAAHAVGAMTVPLGAVILHGNVLQGAVPRADAAAYTLVRYRKLAVSYEQAVEQRFEDI